MKSDSVSKAIKNPTGPEAREMLSKFASGFMESCERAKRGDGYLVVKDEDFGDTFEDYFIQSLAVKYAMIVGVEIVSIANRKSKDNSLGNKFRPSPSVCLS